MKKNKERDIFGMVYISSEIIDSIVRIPNQTSITISDYVIEHGTFINFPTELFQENTEESAARFRTLQNIIFSFDPIYFSKKSDARIYFEIDITDGYYLNKRIAMMNNTKKIPNLMEIKRVVKQLDEQEIFGYLYYNQRNGWFNYAELKKSKNEFGEQMDSLINSISD